MRKTSTRARGVSQNEHYVMDIDDRFKLAISLRNKQDFTAAANAFEEIINLFPNHPSLPGVYGVLGDVYSDLEDHENSYRCFRCATNEKPNSELASLGLYLSCVELEEYDEAIAEINRFLSNNKPELYKTTILELLGDMEFGYALDHKETIIKLANKFNIKLGQG